MQIEVVEGGHAGSLPSGIRLHGVIELEREAAGQGCCHTGEFSSIA